MPNKKISFELKPHDIREMKSKLHTIKPTIVIDTQGLTSEILQQIDHALTNNELIKIRTLANTSEELTEIASTICTSAKAVLIQTIGYIIAIYRKNLQFED